MGTTTAKTRKNDMRERDTRDQCAQVRGLWSLRFTAVKVGLEICETPMVKKRDKHGNERVNVYSWAKVTTYSVHICERERLQIGLQLAPHKCILQWKVN
jgi:hypothetical protein